MAKAEGERTEQRKDTKRKKERIQKANSRRRDEDSKNSVRFDKDQESRRNSF